MSVFLIQIIKRTMSQKKKKKKKKAKWKFPHFADLFKFTIDSLPDCFQKSFEYWKKMFHMLPRDFW